MTTHRLAANRDFRLLWIGGLLSGLGGYTATLALPMLVLAETGSPTDVGFVSAAAGVAVLVCMLPGGAITDATERRRLMIVGQLAAATLALGLAAAVHAGRVSLLAIGAVAVAGPVLSTLYGPAAAALLASAVPAEQFGAAVSRMQARSAAARLIGPLIGGILFAQSAALPLVAEGIGLVGSVLCLAAVRARSAPTARASDALKMGHLTLGLRFLWQQPFLRNSTLLFGIGLNAGFAGVMTIAIAQTGLSDSSGRATSVVLAAAAVGTLLGTLAAAPLKVHERPRTAVLVAGWTVTGAVSLLVVVTAVVPVVVLIALSLFTGALGSVAFVSALLTLTPQDLLGRVQSAASLTSMVSMPAGPLVGGVLLERAGHTVAVGVFALVITGCAVIATTARRIHSTA